MNKVLAAIFIMLITLYASAMLIISSLTNEPFNLKTVFLVGIIVLMWFASKLLKSMK